MWEHTFKTRRTLTGLMSSFVHSFFGQPYAWRPNPVRFDDHCMPTEFTRSVEYTLILRLFVDFYYY